MDWIALSSGSNIYLVSVAIDEGTVVDEFESVIIQTEFEDVIESYIVNRT